MNCVLLLLLAVQGGDGPTELSRVEPAPNVLYEDILAGYDLNASSFGRMRVTWSYAVHRPRAWRDYQEAEIRRYERLLALAADEQMKQKLSGIIESMRKNLGSSPNEEWYLKDVWADGECLQVRTPWPDPVASKEAQQWQFSDEPLTPDTLMSAYKNYRNTLAI